MEYLGRYLLKAAWINALIVVIGGGLTGLVTDASASETESYFILALGLIGILNISGGLLYALSAFFQTADARPGVAMMILGAIMLTAGLLWGSISWHN